MSTTGKEHYSDLPEAYTSPGHDLPEPYAAPGETKETVRGSEEKQVARHDAPEVDHRQASEGAGDYAPVNEHSRSKARRRRRWIIILTVVLIVLAIALGVGLGVGLSHSGSDDGSGAEGSNSSNSQSPLAPQDRSTRGAFNGTGISPSFKARFSEEGNLQEESDNQNTLMVYQHYTGELRWAQRITANDSWYGGTADQVIATNARNATPIDSTLVRRPSLNSSVPQLELHVFYINDENIFSHRWTSESSTDWYDGPLNNLNQSAPSGSRVALRGGQYTEVTGSGNSATQEPCIVALLGTDSTTIEAQVWCPNLGWQFERKWIWNSVNGGASPAYMGWTSDALMYVMLIDENDDLSLYWRDGYSENDDWHLASTKNVDLEDSSSLLGLGFDSAIGRRSYDGSITNWNATLAAGNSTITDSSWSIDSPRMLENSQVATSLTPLKERQIALFYQMEGDDITISGGTTEGGFTSTVTWPLPDD